MQYHCAWAAWYYTGLLIKLTPKGIVFPLFFFFSNIVQHVCAQMSSCNSARLSYVHQNLPDLAFGPETSNMPLIKCFCLSVKPLCAYVYIAQHKLLTRKDYLRTVQSSRTED